MAVSINRQRAGTPSADIDRVQYWARTFPGAQPRFDVMAAPPTITFGGNTSSVNASKVNGATDFNAQNAVFDHQGSVFLNETAAGGYPIRTPNHITTSAGAKSGGSAPIRARFMTDAASVDFAFYDSQYSQFNLLVDGQFIARDRTAVFRNSGNYRYVKADFGTNATTYGKASTSTSITSAGTGYAVGDVVTFDGGSGAAAGTPLTMVVAQLSGSAVAGLDVVNKGAYTSQPTGTMSQASTTGAGTGLQITAAFFHPEHSVNRMRRIELVYSQPAKFLGIVVPSNNGIVLPCAVPAAAPKVAFIGDSITIGTYLQYGASHIGSSIAQRLGWWDRHIVSGIGGTGWNAGTTPWSHANRIQDFIDYDADVYVFIGSQNDTAGTALEGKIRDTLNALMAARPDAYVVGIGNILGGSTSLAASIETGFAAASHQSRLRFINNQSPNPWINAAHSTSWTVTGDANHLSQAGMDRFADIAAEHIAQAVLGMAL
jgi:hypothetical protein